MRRRGRPVLGAIAGLFLGLFVGLDLAQFGVRPPDNVSVIVLPLAGLVLGLGLALWAPFGRKRAAAAGGPAAGGPSSGGTETAATEITPEPAPGPPPDRPAPGE